MNNTYDIADFIRVGGGGESEQRTMEQTVMQDSGPDVIVIQQDNTAVWVAGVIVPVAIAIIGWWLQHKWRKDNPNMPLTIANIKKSREK